MENEAVKKIDMRKVALRYLSKGRSVIPVGVNKKPLIQWEEFTERLPTEDEVVFWWEQFPEANIAIITGEISETTIVDVEAGGDISIFPKTKTVRTGGGGWHLYYQYCSKIKNGVRVLPLTDIRNDSGYVVAPPSLHQSGNRYTWINGGKKVEFPAHLFQSKENKTESITKDANEWDEILKGVEEGRRNEMATRLCGRYMNKTNPDVWEELVWSKLRRWNKRNEPPLGTNELRSIFDSIAQRETANRTASDPENEKYELKVISATELSELPIEENPHVVEKLIPEKAITILTADGGSGKSLFALIVARHVALGEKLFGVFEVKKQKVLYMDLEMEAGTVKGRNRSVIGDGDIPLDYIMECDWRIDQPVHYRALKELILREQYGFVVFDTLSSIHEAKEGVPEEMNKINRLVLRLIRETNITPLIIHHNRKEPPGGKRTIHSARGATAIIDKAASHILIDSTGYVDKELHEITEMTISKLKHRVRRVQPFKLVVSLDPVREKATWSYDGEVRAVKKEREIILEILNEATGGDPLDVEEIIDEVKKINSAIGKTLIRKTLKSLVNQKVIEEQTRGRGKLFYSLVED